jgi:hypothetical protein
LGIDIARKLPEQRERECSERCGFGSWLNDGQSRAMADHQARGDSRARDRHADLQPAIGGRAPQLLGDRLRVAEQPRQAAEIEEDFPLEGCSARQKFKPRRELARDLEQRVGRTAFRGIHNAEHINLRSLTR